MTATSRVTKAAVERAAKKAYGEKARITENPKAVVGADRQAKRERQREIAARIRELDDIPSLTSADAWRALIKAARFVADVNGDHPSIPRLADELARSEELADRIDERQALKAERDRLVGLLLTDRYRVVVTSGIFTHVKHGADTLPDLLAKIEGREP